MTAPHVSVLIPVLNAAPFLDEAIGSILAQDLEDLELIVVDDGSNDGSQQIAERWQSRDRRIHTAALPRDPSTASGARAANVGLALARGDYIARMDADDIATPDRLSVQLAWLQSQDLDICGGQTLRFGDRQGEIWYPERQEAIAFELVFRSGMANAAMLARGDVLRAARFSETEAYEEYELQTRLISEVRLGNCPSVVLRLRSHAGQATHVLRDHKDASRQRLRFAHFFRLFPGAEMDDFRCVNAVARGLPLGGVAELDRAGDWLVRLSRLPDDRLRRRMTRRWTDTCARYTGPATDLTSRAEDFAEQILSPP